MYKIFVTVGSRFPMDRLVSSVDDYIGTRNDIEGFAQVGNSNIETVNLPCSQFLNSQSFIEKIINADLVVSHAGMGNILLARENQKKIIILPRKSAYGEHIDDHQLDTVMGLKNYPGIFVADDVTKINSMVKEIISQSDDFQFKQSNEKKQLIKSLKKFIDNC